MINSHFKFGIPNNSLEIIHNLKNNLVFSLKTCEIIKGMKAFRNVLVHVHDKLDDKLAFHNIQASINDFSLIEDEILIFLKKEMDAK